MCTHYLGTYQHVHPGTFAVQARAGRYVAQYTPAMALSPLITKREPHTDYLIEELSCIQMRHNLMAGHQFSNQKWSVLLWCCRSTSEYSTFEWTR